MRHSQLVINSISTQDVDLEIRLHDYRRAGFEKVEFSLAQIKNKMAVGFSLEQIKKMLRQSGLTCIGGFESTISCFGESRQRIFHNQQIIQNANMVAELGGSILVVGTDGPSKKISDPLKQMSEVVAEVAHKVEDTGVTICIEFNWSPFVKSLRTAAEIARGSEMSNVGVLFDTAHYYCTPTKFDQLSIENVSLIKHVHINDMKDIPAEFCDHNRDRVLPGQGCLDLSSILNRLELHGYCGHFSIEMFSQRLWDLPTEDAAKEMYESLLPFCL
ncbi:xylose isomerase [Candidatus Poribacteria bacterium]|mgnify:FL=1|nr:xylose isomerase [Candidatus Poribacteria bacterium]